MRSTSGFNASNLLKSPPQVAGQAQFSEQNWKICPFAVLGVLSPVGRVNGRLIGSWVVSVLRTSL